MKLVKSLRLVRFLGLFFGLLGAFVNTSMAMSTKLPTFVMASEKTKIILSGYTEQCHQELFESNFPVSNFYNIVEAVNTVQEIRDLACDPGLNCDVKVKMEEIACDLILYLRNKITENQAVLLPEIKVHLQKLSFEQQDLVKVVYEEHGSGICVFGTAACGFATAAIVVALFILNKYPAQKCFE